jgi:hypothetical protein
LWFYTTNLPSLCPELGMLVISTTPSFEASLQKEQPRGLTGGVQPSSVPPGPPGFLVLVSRLGALSAPWGGLCRCLGNRPPAQSTLQLCPSLRKQEGKVSQRQTNRYFLSAPSVRELCPIGSSERRTPPTPISYPKCPELSEQDSHTIQ